MIIRRAKINELAEIMAVTRACAAHMQAAGIFQWNDHYPSEKDFRNDIDRKELYVLHEAGELIAFIALTPIMDEEYKSVQWLTENGNNLYVHRLAVHPDQQANGYAQALMSYAENLARGENYTSIRLDTFSQNTRNQKFYEKRGYKRLGDIFLPMQSPYPFHCYELVL